MSNIFSTKSTKYELECSRGDKLPKTKTCKKREGQKTRGGYTQTHKTGHTYIHDIHTILTYIQMHIQSQNDYAMLRGGVARNISNHVVKNVTKTYMVFTWCLQLFEFGIYLVFTWLLVAF